MSTPQSTTQVPFIDLVAQYQPIRAEILAAVEKVFDEQSFILGPHVSSFESALAEYLGRESDSVIGVSSGTDALLSALMSLGVGPGDKVLTTPFSFFATAGTIARLHATPVLCDIDPITMNLDPKALAAFDPNDFKAIVVVHLFGRTAAMDAVQEWAAPGNVPIVEDAAQAIGAKNERGEPCGYLGDLGCFSFFPTKNLGAAGDGGCVTTKSHERAKHLRMIRVHGAYSDRRYESEIIGGNFRLDAVQAAVLETKLKYLDAWTNQRLANATQYNELLKAAGLGDQLALPEISSGHQYIAHQYVLRTNRRDELAAHLKSQGIGCAVYYPQAFHQMNCFRDLGYAAGDLPEAERAAQEVLALPIFAELGEARLKMVVAAIIEFFDR